MNVQERVNLLAPQMVVPSLEVHEPLKISPLFRLPLLPVVAGWCVLQMLVTCDLPLHSVLSVVWVMCLVGSLKSWHLIMMHLC